MRKIKGGNFKKKRGAEFFNFIFVGEIEVYHKYYSNISFLKKPKSTK